jgi:WD40 repeat protein
MGLTHYEEKDAAFFFGRDRDREIISANLSARRLTLLYGESGVGKSSVLRAGVLHDLLARMRSDLDGGRRPRFVPAVFGDWRDDPSVGLLREVSGAVAAVADAQPPAPSADVPLDEGLDALAKVAGGELLIVLDQFEEYFLYHSGDDRFADEFPRAVNRLDLRAHFLISIREDQLAQLDRFKRRLPRLFESTLRIGHLDLESAREAIERPIAAYNSSLGDPERPIEIGPGLVSAVLEQLQARVELDNRHEGAPKANGGPPRIEASYLQLVMATIWDEEMKRGSRVLRLSTLEELGGAGEIVRGHLDRVLGSLTPTEQEIAGAALRFLVSGSGTKISHTLSDLAEFTGRDEEELRSVLKQLADPERRILRSSAGNPGPQTERYELFHDVLASAVLDWRRRQAREQLERQAARERRKAFLALGAAAGFLVLAASAVAVGVWALQQKRSAEHERQVARSRALLATATDQFGERLDRGILLSLEAYRTHPSAETRGGLIAAVERTDHLTRILRIGPTAGQLALDGRGRFVATADEAGAEVLDLHPPLKKVASIHTGAQSAALGPGGTVLAVGAGTSLLRRDLERGQPLPTLHVPKSNLIAAVAFSADGRRIAAVSDTGRVMLWDAGTGRRLAPPVSTLGASVGVVAGAVPGAIAVISTERNGGQRVSVLRFDHRGDLVVRSRTQEQGPIADVALSANGRHVASVTRTGRLMLWDVTSGRSTSQRLKTEDRDVWALALDWRHRAIAVGLGDGTIQLWRGSRAVLTDELTGHNGPVLDLAFTADGKELVSSGDDGTLLLWKPESSTLRRTLGSGLFSGSVGDASIAGDGSQIAAVSTFGGPVRAWRLRGRSFRPVAVAVKPVRRAAALAYAPHGWTLAVGGAGGTVVLAEAGRTTVHVVAKAVAKARRGGGIMSVALGGSRMIAWARGDGTVVVEDLTNARKSKLPSVPSIASDLALSPDGKLLAVGGSDGTSLWDARTGKRLARPVRGRWVDGVAFDPEARILASALENGVVLWDVRHNRRMGTALGTGSDHTDSLAFSADGKTLAAGTDRGTAGFGHLFLWDVATGQPLGLPQVDRSGWPVRTVAFGPHGRLVTGSGVLTIWSDLLWSNVPGMERRLCSVVGRNLSPGDWHAFVPWAHYRRTCPNLPAVG